MELWSKGLGRMVLGVRLSERTEMDIDGERAIIRGTMGSPGYWGYDIRLDHEDVGDFRVLLKQPAAVGFVVTSSHRWRILAAALHSAVVFAWAIASRVLFRRSSAASPSASPLAGNQTVDQGNQEKKQG